MADLLPRAIAVLNDSDLLVDEIAGMLAERSGTENPIVGLLSGESSARFYPLERGLGARGFQSWSGTVRDLPTDRVLDLLLIFELPQPDEILYCAQRTNLLLLAPLSHLTDPGRTPGELAPWLDGLAASGRRLLDWPRVGEPSPLGDLGALLFAPPASEPGNEVSRLWLQLAGERWLNRRRQQLALDQRDLLGSITVDFERLSHQFSAPSPAVNGERTDPRFSQVPTPAVQLVARLQRARARFAPSGSRRENIFLMLVGWLRILDRGGLGALASHLIGEVRWRSRTFQDRVGLTATGEMTEITVKAVKRRTHTLTAHDASVDIVICVHNAADDVTRCLDSVLSHTYPPFRLILVNDGSESTTSSLLEEYAQRFSDRIVLLHNREARGYTLAANQGMGHGTGDFVLLLNSDTIVGPEWLDRLIACAESDPGIGMVGPLSNTASWQSVPRISQGDDWADNSLPAGESVDSWSAAIAATSARLYPPMPFLNGFCLLIRRQMIDEIGYFDEERFGAGYGEENDYALRARAAGWQLSLADDVYIHHAQSRSYSHERRKMLSDRAGQILIEKHGSARIDAGVAYCRDAPVLQRIRARVAHLAERRRILEEGSRYRGRRLLWVLPLDGPAGGGNVVVSEAEAMQRMGVEVEIFNLIAKKPGFEAAYPGLSIPQRWGVPEELKRLLPEYDASLATWHESVAWIAPGAAVCRLGYYVQDFEPYFYAADSPGEKAARASYRAAPDLHCFTKTEWTRQTLLEETGVDAAVVGPSVDVDLFRPAVKPLDAPSAPIKVVAMVRPSSPRRSPHLTMELLRRLSHRFGDQVEITIFGVAAHDPGLATLPQDFRFRLAGVLDRSRVATLLGDCQIFADFSTYQAMGLTALEAMACGAAVIVPARGGADSFARDGENALVVNSADADECWSALSQLVMDPHLRDRLGSRAIYEAASYFPERAALATLQTIFAEPGAARE